MPTFKTPTINELIEAIKADKPIFYHAPMDHAPAMIRIRQYCIVPGNPEAPTNRITMSSRDIKALTVSLFKHLDRFRLITTVSPAIHLLDTRPLPPMPSPALQARGPVTLCQQSIVGLPETHDVFKVTCRDCLRELAASAQLSSEVSK